MSYWKTLVENEISKIKTFNYPKLNVIQQEIADLFQKEKLSPLEVTLILEAMKSHDILNTKIALEIHRSKYGPIYKAENILGGDL